MCFIKVLFTSIMGFIAESFRILTTCTERVSYQCQAHADAVPRKTSVDTYYCCTRNKQLKKIFPRAASHSVQYISKLRCVSSTRWTRSNSASSQTISLHESSLVTDSPCFIKLLNSRQINACSCNFIQPSHDSICNVAKHHSKFFFNLLSIICCIFSKFSVTHGFDNIIIIYRFKIQITYNLFYCNLYTYLKTINLLSICIILGLSFNQYTCSF